MNTVTLTFHGKPQVLSAPSSWNEITPFQLRAWILVLYTDLPESEKLELTVPIFYNIKPKLFKAIAEHYRVQMAPGLRFLFKEDNLLNKWLIKTVKLRFKTFYGPADKLSNLTAFEFFNYCEAQYWKYKADKQESNLNALVGILYREKREGIINNDIRCDLTDAGVAKRAKLARSLPSHIKHAIFFNYEGCRNTIAKLHKKSFSTKGGKLKKRSDVTIALAGGPLGDLNNTRQANLYDFLLHLEDLIDREEKLKAND